VEQMQATEKQNYQLMTIMCVVLHKKLNELDMLIDMMLNMDKQSRYGAARPFKLSSVQPQENLNETKTDQRGPGCSSTRMPSSSSRWTSPSSR
jgi:hypothetical protein